MGAILTHQINPLDTSVKNSQMDTSAKVGLQNGNEGNTSVLKDSKPSNHLSVA